MSHKPAAIPQSASARSARCKDPVLTGSSSAVPRLMTAPIPNPRARRCRAARATRSMADILPADAALRYKTCSAYAGDIAMNFRPLLVALAAGMIFCQGCSTVETTKPGAVGVDRKQRMLVSEAEVEKG